MKLKTALCRANQCLSGPEKALVQKTTDGQNYPEGKKAKRVCFAQYWVTRKCWKVCSHGTIQDYSLHEAEDEAITVFTHICLARMSTKAEKKTLGNTSTHQDANQPKDSLCVCVCVYKQMHDKNKRENLRPSADSLKIYIHCKEDFTELFPCMCVEFPRTLCCINTSFPIQSDPRKPRPINPLPMPWTCTAIQNLHIHSMNVPLLKHRGHMTHIPRIAKRQLISIISQGEEISLHKTQ